jgi:2-keto-4-pentenoate hydratase
MTDMTLSRAQLIVDAHRSGGTIAEIDTPPDIEAAMLDQAEVVKALRADVAGWKVAVNPEAGPVAAPMMAQLMKQSSTAWPLSPGLIIEIELAVRLRRDLPPRTYTRAEIADAIDSMVVGVEMVRFRIATGSKAPFLTLLADAMSNEGYVSGSRAMPWRDVDLAALRCTATLDGRALHDGPCTHPLGDPLAPVVAWASAQKDKLGGLRAGQLVTTGSVCGMVPVTQTGRLVAGIEGLGEVEIDIVGNA